MHPGVGRLRGGRAPKKRTPKYAALGAGAASRGGGSRMEKSCGSLDTPCCGQPGPLAGRAVAPGLVGPGHGPAPQPREVRPGVAGGRPGGGAGGGALRGDAEARYSQSVSRPRIWPRDPQAGGTHTSKQCAADSSHFSATSTAPQRCSRRRSRRLACHGHSPRPAALPPTILVSAAAGARPQSAGRRGRVGGRGRGGGPAPRNTGPGPCSHEGEQGLQVFPQILFQTCVRARARVSSDPGRWGCPPCQGPGQRPRPPPPLPWPLGPPGARLSAALEPPGTQAHCPGSPVGPTCSSQTPYLGPAPPNGGPLNTEQGQFHESAEGTPPALQGLLSPGTLPPPTPATPTAKCLLTGLGGALLPRLSWQQRGVWGHPSSFPHSPSPPSRHQGCCPGPTGRGTPRWAPPRDSARSGHCWAFLLWAPTWLQQPPAEGKSPGWRPGRDTAAGE